jgi:hypothetical protein
VAICCRCAAYPNIVAAVAQAKAQMASADDRGHDKIGATAYANLDKKGTQQKVHISRKARIVPWICFRTALWTIAGTPWPNFPLMATMRRSLSSWESRRGLPTPVKR